MLAWLLALTLMQPDVRGTFPGWTFGEAGPFIVATPTARGHERALTIVRDAVGATTREYFTTPPAGTWTAFVLPDAAAYRRFVAAHYAAGDASGIDVALARTSYGVADVTRRWLVVNHGPGPGTLAHEVVHPLLAADFPAAPLWLDEGFAALFEHKRYVDGRMQPLVNWRMPVLRGRVDDLSVRALMQSDDPGFRASGALGMAAARHWLLWIHNQGWLSGFYRRFRDDRSDATGITQLEAVSGRSLDALESEWKAWVRRR